ncbi:MAG: hypothetical protein MUE96_12440 [Bacteroidia bacterium]|jgi:hypothetical protein|nr:hypothetical protein [Bacteroidia bacterium]
MKIKYIYIALSVVLLSIGCVQPTRKVVVKVILRTTGLGTVQTAGLRGSDKPLSWTNDFALTPVKTDTLYEGHFTLVTGYTFTEVKFTLNGQFEAFESNRRIVLSNQDTTVYEAVFNQTP